mgnify:CR=1 FL=1
MNSIPSRTARAPVGQQGNLPRALLRSTPWRSLRNARGPLLGYGTPHSLHALEPPKIWVNCITLDTDPAGVSHEAVNGTGVRNQSECSPQ